MNVIEQAHSRAMYNCTCVCERVGGVLHNLFLTTCLMLHGIDDRDISTALIKLNTSKGFWHHILATQCW